MVLLGFPSVECFLIQKFKNRIPHWLRHINQLFCCRKVRILNYCLKSVLIDRDSVGCDIHVDFYSCLFENRTVIMRDCCTLQWIDNSINNASLRIFEECSFRFTPMFLVNSKCNKIQRLKYIRSMLRKCNILNPVRTKQRIKFFRNVHWAIVANKNSSFSNEPHFFSHIFNIWKKNCF